MISFRKTDRNAILLLILIVVVVVVTFPLLGEREDASTLPSQLRSGLAKNRHSVTQKPQYYAQKQDATGELFYFDPNTADSTQLLRLGLLPGRCAIYISIARRGAGIARRKISPCSMA